MTQWTEYDPEREARDYIARKRADREERNMLRLVMVLCAIGFVSIILQVWP
jgi:hypothetical protein